MDIIAIEPSATDASTRRHANDNTLHNTTGNWNRA